MARAVLAGSALACAATPAFAQLTVTRQFDVNRYVPDGGAYADVRSLGIGAGNIADVKVSLKISGLNWRAFNGDLFASVGHGDQMAVLLNRPGRRSGNSFGYGDSGMDVTFSDDATRDIHNYRAELSGNHTTRVSGGVTGTWQPDGRAVDPGAVLDTSPRTAALSSFQGQSADGEWRLLVADLSRGGDAFLHSWGLQIRTTAAPAGDLQFGGDTIQGGGAVNSFLNHIVLSSQNLVSGPTDLSFLGPISGDGALHHTGSGVLTLGAANSFCGGVQVNSGTLVVGHDEALGTGALTLAGGTLDSGGCGRNLPNAVQINGGGSITGTGPITIHGQTQVAGASSLNIGTTVTLAGELSSDGDPGTQLTKRGSGTLIIAGHNSFTAPTIVEDGVMNVQGSLSGSSVTVQGGGVLSGSGTVGSLTVMHGGTLSPGNSPGTGNNVGDLIWGAGGNYLWEINKASGTAGADPGWDLLSASGALQIAATSGEPFRIELTSLLLLLPSAAGPVEDFNSSVSYSWVIATAANGVSGFDASKFILDTSAFQNALHGGSFSLQQSGNSVQLNFNSVPEPGAWAVLTGLGLLAFGYRRRRE